MKSIGILTFHASTNYGALLQVYALQRFIQQSGYDSEVINLSPSRQRLSALSPTRRFSHLLWNQVLARMLVGDRRAVMTQKFRNNNLKLTKTQYSSSDELKLNPPKFDAYICGSDQVWNLTHTNFNTSYLLDFVPPGGKRISYAASLGKSQISKREHDILSRWLPEFNHISVRERSAVRIIQELVGVKPAHVLDPTFLLAQEEWASLANEPIVDAPYILCYYMPGNKKVNRNISRVAKQLSRATGSPIYNLGQKEYHKLISPNASIFDAGPIEFVNLFKNAEHILTNSFHGTAFSIIFNKSFYAFVDDQLSPEANLSDRLTDLLNILGLEQRVFGRKQSDLVDASQMSNVDYKRINIALRKLVLYSRDYLLGAINS